MTAVKSLWGNRGDEAFFRRSFELAARPQKAYLRIFVDTGYELWLNGRFVAVVDEWHNTRDYDVTLFLKAGKNLVAVHGMNHSGHRGFAFELCADGRQITVSDENWKCADTELWGWQTPGYDDRTWGNARILPLQYAGLPQWSSTPGDGSLPIIPPVSNAHFLRGSIPKCVDSPFFNSEMPEFTPAAGAVDVAGDGYAASAAAVPPAMEYPAEISEVNSGGKLSGGVFTVPECGMYTGPSILIDFKQEVVGYFRMRLKSEGRICFRLHFGETIVEALNIPPREKVLRRMLSEEISLFPGEQEFEARSRVACRFVRVEFLDCTAPVTASEFHFRQEFYPVAYKGYFHSSDEELNAVWKAGRKTLHFCMQEYYLDAPKRDQMLWTGDAWAETLYNYYLFADKELFKFCWDELARCQYPDGSIPSSLGVGASVIWDYSAWWIIAFHDCYMHTGEVDFLRKHAPTIYRAMDFLLDKCGDEPLLNVPENPGVWMVTLWNGSGVDPLMNALFLRSLEAAVEVCTLCGDTEKAAAYKDKLSRVRPAVEGLLKRSPLWEEKALLDHSVGRLCMTEALFQAGKSEEALEFLRRSWVAMLRDSEAETLSEGFASNRTTLYPSQNDRSLPLTFGSYCHGWTAGPCLLLPREIAGIKPLEPGFRRFSVKPVPVDLSSFETVIPTPYGEIAFALRVENGQWHGKLAVPEGTEAELCLPEKTLICPSGITEF